MLLKRTVQAATALLLATVMATTEAAAADVTLVVGQAVRPTQFHPLLAPGGGRETRAIKRQIFDALVVQDDNLRPQPQLAKSWTIENDVRWIFELRDDVSFHNAERFNAETVKWNLERILDPNSTAPGASTLRTLIESVEVTGEYQVTVTTKSPAPTLLITLAFVELAPKNLVEEVGDEAFAAAPIGTGPFLFVSRDGSTVQLKRNDAYWGGPAASAEVTFTTIPELSSRIAALRAGEIHIADQIPPDQVVQLSGNVAPATATGTRIFFMAMNVNEPPFDSVAVRQAVALAFDRDLIAQALYGGRARPLNQPAFPEMFGYQPDLAGFRYDPAAARAVLSTVTAPVTLSVRQVDFVLAQAVAGFLADAGLKVELALVEDAAFNDSITGGRLQSYVSSWGVAEGDVDAILHPHFWSERGANRRYTNYANPALDALFYEGRSTTDSARRFAVYADALRLLVDEAPWAVLVNPMDIYGVSNDLTGWMPSPTGMYRINEARVGGN
ncbi:MAG: hypothetical protein KJZ85_04855 [Rhodobacteraceae bacterium]|nr:hypothetical protein [Paracoccaceae bacterium]